MKSGNYGPLDFLKTVGKLLWLLQAEVGVEFLSMASRYAKWLLLALASSVCFAQATQRPGDPQSAPKVDAQQLPPIESGESSSKPQLPLPSDAQVPDNPPTSTQPKHQSKVKRKLRQLAPECATVFFKGVCWAAHPVPPPSTLPENEQAANKAIEVGDFYYAQKNYRAAESRFREALEYTPDSARAHFKLAQALEKLGKIDEARQNYEMYLKTDPNGEFAAAARKALTQAQADSLAHPR
jgi:tetratricopeptide (TPR) repeat protein